jgi:hypothetical protein
MALNEELFDRGETWVDKGEGETLYRLILIHPEV